MSKLQPISSEELVKFEEVRNDDKITVCPICHTLHDCDINTSINILTEGLKIKAFA